MAEGIFVFAECETSVTFADADVFFTVELDKALGTSLEGDRGGAYLADRDRRYLELLSNEPACSVLEDYQQVS